MSGNKDGQWVALLVNRVAGCVTHFNACDCRSEAVRQVLRDVLSAELKSGDAPMSADTHTDRALVLLKWLCDGWMPYGIEMQQRMAEAEEHMRLSLANK